MQKKQLTYKLRQTLVLGIAVMATIFGITMTAPASFTTTDQEASALKFELEGKEESEVLGVDTEGDSQLDSGCSTTKPIIGWIDFSGKKVIKTKLPTGQRASSCFENLEVAKKNGFVVE